MIHENFDSIDLLALGELQEEKRTGRRSIPKRNVKCMICGDHMYYFGEEPWIPEVHIKVEGGGGTSERHFVHLSCWETLKKKDKI